MNLNRADFYMLKELVEADVADDVEFGTFEALSEGEHDAFADMLGRGFALTEKQRAWARNVCERVGINPVPPEDRPPVPRGREVELAPVLRNLPKRPPGRKP